MNISQGAAHQFANVQQLFGTAMLKSAQSADAAKAMVMLEDLQENTESIKEIDPALGSLLDVKA